MIASHHPPYFGPTKAPTTVKMPLITRYHATKRATTSRVLPGQTNAMMPAMMASTPET